MTLRFKPPNTTSILINDTFKRKSAIPLAYIKIYIYALGIMWFIYFFFNIIYFFYLVERLLDLGRWREELIELDFDNV
jgi:hypothetical protein